MKKRVRKFFSRLTGSDRRSYYVREPSQDHGSYPIPVNESRQYFSRSTTQSQEPSTSQSRTMEESYSAFQSTSREERSAPIQISKKEESSSQPPPERPAIHEFVWRLPSSTEASSSSVSSQEHPCFSPYHQAQPAASHIHRPPEREASGYSSSSSYHSTSETQEQQKKAPSWKTATRKK